MSSHFLTKPSNRVQRVNKQNLTLVKQKFKSKKLVLKWKIKNKLIGDAFIEGQRFDDFTFRYYVLSQSLDDTINGKKNYRRRIIQSLFNFILWVVIINAALSLILSPSSSPPQDSRFRINHVMAWYLSQNKLKFSVTLLWLLLLAMIGVIQAQLIRYEWTNKVAYLFRDVYYLKYYKTNNDHRLVEKNVIRMRILIKLLNLLMLKFVHPILVVGCVFFFAISIVIFYHRRVDDFFTYWPFAISWLLLKLILSVQTPSFAVALVEWLVLVFVFLKLRFQQINDSLQKTKLFSIRKLKSIIQDHQEVCRKLDVYNETCSKPMAAFYFFSTFIIDTAVYLAIYGSNIRFRLLGVLFAVPVFVFSYFIILLMASINDQAHKPLKAIHTICASNKLDMTTNDRIKCANFIGHLTDMSIGLTCNDTFVFSHDVFFQYVMYSGSSFILLMGLLE